MCEVCIQIRKSSFKRLRSYSCQVEVADLVVLNSSAKYFKTSIFFYCPILSDSNMIQLEFSSVHTFYGKFCVNERSFGKIQVCQIVVIHIGDEIDWNMPTHLPHKKENIHYIEKFIDKIKHIPFLFMLWRFN